MTSQKPRYTLFPLTVDKFTPAAPVGLILEVNGEIWAWNFFNSENDATAAVLMFERFFNVATGTEPAVVGNTADAAEILRDAYRNAKKPADESAGNSELTQFEKKKVNNFTQIVSNRAGIVNRGGAGE